MSVFYHNDDPLLHQTLFQNTMMNQANPSNINDAYAQLYRQQILADMQQHQQQQLQKDWLGDLDNEMKSLDSSTIELLNKDSEFSTLNAQLQGLIQSEIMSLVKVKVNINNGAIDNIKRQMEIMKSASNKVKEEEKQNFNDLNDYLKNYSHLTFDQYRNLKNGKPIQEEENVEVVTTSTSNNNKKTKKQIEV